MQHSLKLLVDSLRLRFLYIEHYHFNPSWYVAPEVLPYSIIRYVTKGEFDFELDGVKHCAKTGQIIYLPHKALLSSRAKSSKVSFISIRFQGEISFLSHRLWSEVLRIPNVLPVEALELAPIFYEMIDIYRENTIGQTLLLQGQLQLLVAGILNELYNNGGAGGETDNLLDTRIQTIIEYLLCHPEYEPDLSELCSLVQVSESSLRRLFLQYTGMSPLKFIYHLKMDQAKKLLMETDERIADIGYRSGFADANYFSRTFKKIVGITPHEFRKMYRVV